MTDLPLEEQEFITRLEEANQIRFDDPEWSFNQPQREAILHSEGPLHITAGPGSGKTEVLICRAIKLLLVDRVSPDSIFLTTFTEKAAQNLEERIADRLQRIGYADAVDPNEIRTGTLHSLCRNIMQEYRFEDYTTVELLDEDGQKLFMYEYCDFVDILRGGADADDWETVSGANLSEGIWQRFNNLRAPWEQSSPPNKWESTDMAAELFNRLSQYRAGIDQLREGVSPAWRVCAEGLERYRETLQEHQRSDFARLLEQFIEFLDTPGGDNLINGDPDRDRPPLRHVLVDEYQDTNPLQQELYFRLAEELAEPNITVVGDDDQALYRFRGGTVECLIKFPERAQQRLDVPVTSLQLKTNYRSTDDIVAWCNRYVDHHPAMQWAGVRAPGKEPMDVGRDGTDGRTSVRSLFIENSDLSPAESAAEVVDQLHAEDYIDDYSQVAFLFRSTQESEDWAGPYVQALQDRGIPVHNPRNKAYLEHPEIQFVLGALIRILDPLFEGADTDWLNLRGGVRDQVETWVDRFDDFVEKYDARQLELFVTSEAQRVQSAEEKESLGYTALDLIYRILAHEPFQTWIEGSDRPDRGRRLGRLSTLLDSFMGVSGGAHLYKSGNAASVTTTFLGSFYWTFCGYLQSSDFDEPEDPHDQLPAGFVQMMTTHQAKGLEFPVVFVCDLDSEPWTGGTHWLESELEPYADINPIGDPKRRAERDEIRRFYVSYSRAEEDLILVGPDGAAGDLSLGYTASGVPLEEDWFTEDRRIEDPTTFVEQLAGDVGTLSSTDLKRRYSITGDVLAYRRCKRQYGYYNELGFTPNHVTQLFFGRVVHETLDRAHRHYAGELAGVSRGEVPTDDEIADYFDNVAEALKAQNIYPMSEEAEKTALEYIQRFNRNEGEDLYPRVLDTERHLQSNRDEFILEGVVDVIVGDDGKSYEIWDYKAGQRPSGDGDTASELNDYQTQLHTYAELYKYREGEYPDRGVIYFLGEEDREDALFEIEFEAGSVEASIDQFVQTVNDIKQDREHQGWFDIGIEDRPSGATCAECDIRWSCPARPEFHGEQ